MPDVPSAESSAKPVTCAQLIDAWLREEPASPLSRAYLASALADLDARLAAVEAATSPERFADAMRAYLETLVCAGGGQ